MSDHAPLPPSGASRWVPCGRSPSLEAVYPEDEESEAAREGTAAHWYMAERLMGRVATVGDLAANGVPIDQDMVDNIQPLLDDVAARRLTDERLRVEERVDMPEIHPTDNWGTPDVVIISPARRTVFIWDEKYGHGFVDAVDNWQLVDYAEGVRELKNLGPDWKYRLCIHQPRNYDRQGPFRVWEIDGAKLAHLVSIMQRAAAVASPTAVASTGPHCRNCRGRAACDALGRAMGYVVDMSLQSADTVTDRVGEELATIMAAEERLRARRTGLEEHIKAQIKRGQRVPGWTIEQGYGREKWAHPVAEVVALGDMMGVDVRAPAAAITPAQARKKGLDAEVSKAYSVTPPGELKLVPVTGSAVNRAFGS